MMMIAIKLTIIIIIIVIIAFILFKRKGAFLFLKGVGLEVSL